MPSDQTIALLKQGRFDTKFRCGRYYEQVHGVLKGGNIYLYFNYNKTLIHHVKTRFEKRKWDPDRKAWYFPITERNIFQFEYLQKGTNPYTPYDVENWTDYSDQIVKFAKGRRKPIELFPHQVEMINLALNGRYVGFGAEMGLGKTLAAIILCEFLEIHNPWWIGPKPAIAAANLEFERWKTVLNPWVMTYNKLVKVVEEYEGDAPRAFIIDESSRISNPTAQRSQACYHVTHSMRREHDRDTAVIVEMTGSPAPKVPTNWWHQSEVLQPGFLAEANTYVLRDQLAFVKEHELEGGQKFVKVASWKDDENKCEHCGELKDHVNHEREDIKKYIKEGSRGQNRTYEYHPFEASVNEIARLGRRLRGQWGIWRKEDCLTLPPKQFIVKQIEPTPDIKNIAATIVSTETRGAMALERLRELSDGFQYEKHPTGEFTDCKGCQGQGEISNHLDEIVPCATCEGTGQIELTKRITVEYPTGKTELLKEQLEINDECGRINIFGGFQATIDRVVKTCLDRSWQVIKADGRGWQYYSLDGPVPMKKEQMLEQFQDTSIGPRLLAFVGQPGAAGMGLTLHAATTTVFYSNDFVPENRIQAEARGHRAGMRDDGGIIVDLFHLPTDRLILTKLKQEENLQKISMDEIRNCFTGA